MSDIKRVWANPESLWNEGRVKFVDGVELVYAPDYDTAQVELAMLREELAAAKRNEHNSEVAYRAAIEKQEELRAELGECKGEYDRAVNRVAAAEQRNAALKAFACEMVEAAFEGGSFDGGDIQDIAVKHGLLQIEQRTEECGEICACSEYGFPTECYRKTELLKSTESGARG